VLGVKSRLAIQRGLYLHGSDTRNGKFEQTNQHPKWKDFALNALRKKVDAK
jgi:hypothetical protein